MVKEARGVVQDVAVELAEGDNGLEGVAERVVGCDETGREERERAPERLSMVSKVLELPKSQRRLTAVMVSMQSTNASWVKYRESDSEYSFHSCPKRSCW